MKRIIALLLVLCMALGMVVSVSAAPASSFTRTLNLVRLIRTLFAKEDEAPTIGELKGNVLTVYVATNGKANADGTKGNPFGTIEAARDAIRDVKKTGLKGIDVIVGSGMYYITETIEFTEEDTGTEKCPIRYIGEEGAIINGGTAFDYTEFERASGDTLALFPKEVQDKLYMLDLGKFGYTPEEIATMKSKQKYYTYATMINVDGKQMDLARYPNANEGWIEIESGYFLDANGNPTKYTDNDKVAKELQAKQTVVKYGEDHLERVLSWKGEEQIYVRGHYRFIWARDDTKLTERYADRDEILLPYSGGYEPVEKGLLFFYNIPEELDAPGEFYIDSNAVLYYYPEENFQTASFTTPILEGSIINITNADYLTLENLTFETSLTDGINFTADNLTIKGCKITDIYESGIEGVGNNFLFTENEVSYIGGLGLNVDGGDAATLTRSGNLICNNYFHNWSTRKTMNFAISAGQCGATVCHNEVAYSGDLGIEIEGPYNTIEYNYVHDTCQFFCDGATISAHGYAYGSVLRYNVVINTGFESPLDIVGVQGLTADMDCLGADFYGNLVYNCTGHGLSLAYSRDSQVTNNLVIKAGRTAFQSICTTFTQDWMAEKPKERKVNDYLQSELWQTAFPELKGIHGKYDPENPYDPMYIKAPANNVIKDNYFFYDKTYRTWLPNQQYMAQRMMDIEAPYYEVSEIEVISEEANRLTTYISKRNKNPITIAEALAIANEACGTVMTEEQLNEVGRIGVEYSIGDIMVQ